MKEKQILKKITFEIPPLYVLERQILKDNLEKKLIQGNLNKQFKKKNGSI